LYRKENRKREKKRQPGKKGGGEASELIPNTGLTLPKNEPDRKSNFFRKDLWSGEVWREQRAPEKGGGGSGSEEKNEGKAAVVQKRGKPKETRERLGGRSRSFW